VKSRPLAGPLVALLLGASAAPVLAQRGAPGRLAQAPAAPSETGSPSAKIDGLRRYGRTLTQARRFDEAIRAYQRLLAFVPGDAEALGQLGQLQAWVGRYDEAIVHYREALAQRPDDPSLRSDLADTLAWAKRLDEAERLYDEVLARRPDFHEALKGLARVRLLRGDVAGAGPVLERALRLYPLDVDLHRDQARLFSQAGQLDGALRAVQSALRLAPADLEARRLLAETQERRKDWPAAIEAWSEVTRLDPESASAHVALGRAYLAQGRLPAAREHAVLAQRMSPSDEGSSQLMAALDREGVLSPLRGTAEWAELLVHAALLPLLFLVSKRVRHALRRRPWAHFLAVWVVPAAIVVNVSTHLFKPWLARWTDPHIFEAGTEVLIIAGLAVALLAVMKREPTEREFAGQVVLALGAHPDDIELGCAGFILKLKASGAQVHGLTLTRGERGTEKPDIRPEEAARAGRFLGLDGLTVLDLPDAGLQDRVGEVKAAIEAKVKELHPTIVLTHSDVDVHGDHRAVHTATREAARGVPTVLCYEDVSTTEHFQPNLFVDISHYLDDHLGACALHATQSHRIYMDPEVIKGRAAHRGLQSGAQYALAFRSLVLVR
jgi:LmbE family N-acetylglucosaminyl deacetylase/tetratricopeptide (TPR) repeat protein